MATSSYIGLAKKFVWAFSVTSYGKTQTNFLANPVYDVSNFSGHLKLNLPNQQSSGCFLHLKYSQNAAVLLHLDKPPSLFPGPAASSLTSLAPSPTLQSVSPTATRSCHSVKLPQELPFPLRENSRVLLRPRGMCPHLCALISRDPPPALAGPLMCPPCPCPRAFTIISTGTFPCRNPRGSLPHLLRLSAQKSSNRTTFRGLSQRI